MPTTDYGIVLPGNLDAPAGAGQMAQMAASFEKRLVQYVPDQATRDSQFGAVDERLVVVTTAAPWFVWVKTGPTAADWLTLYRDTGWVTDGFTAGAGWDVGSFMAGRTVGSTTEIRGEVTRTGTDLVSSDGAAPTPGNIADETMVTVPPSLAPTALGGNGAAGVQGVCRAQSCSGAGQLYPNGRVLLADLATSGKIPQSSWVRFTFTYLMG